MMMIVSKNCIIYYVQAMILMLCLQSSVPDPVVTTSSVATTLIDAEPATFICNVSTPVLNVAVTWLDGSGELDNFVVVEYH